MSNLDAIVRELQQERERLDAAIDALTSIGGKTLTSHTRTMSAAARDSTGEMGEAKGHAEHGKFLVPNATFPQKV